MSEGTPNRAAKLCAAALRALSEQMAAKPLDVDKLAEARDKYGAATTEYIAVLLEQDRPQDAKALREAVVPTLTAAGQRLLASKGRKKNGM